MKRIIGVAGAALCLAFTFDAGNVPTEPVPEVGIEVSAGFSKFVDEIEVADPSYENESIKRTQSKIQAMEEMTATLEEINISDAEIKELAHLVRCEAGNQPLEGKRAVVDVVLNRVDSELFPDSIHDVIYQSGQFSCVRDGNWEKYADAIDETDYEAIELEIAERTDHEIVFFSSNGCANGKLVYIIGDHYFAKR